MEASPSQIIQFFNGFKQSVIPLFQRPYEWKESNWETLWDDVLERYEAATESSHFMGAIVTMPSRSVPVGVAKHLIIDGQQRLTTLTLLLCAIRDELSADARVERTRIQNHYLTNDGYEGWDYFKVLPTQDDREGFKALVDSAESPSLDTPMQRAYRYFRQKIKDGDSDGNPIDVSQLLGTMERKLITVNINLSETEDPYLIFESLNAKGSPLTQADLVRNYFLMRFPMTTQEHIYRDLWLPMQRRLGDNLTEFMRHYLMRDGEEVLKDDVYSQLKKRVQELSQDGVKSALEDMHRVSEYYLKLINPAEERDPSIRESLSQLLKWEVTTSYPLLLKLYEIYTCGNLDKDEMYQCLKSVESFVVRRWVCAIPTNQLKRIFLQAAKSFTATNTLAWLRDNLSSGPAGRRWPHDEEFKQAWQHYKVYSASRRCKLILDALERSYGHKEPAVLDDASIEHVMPQTLTDKWRTVIAVDGDPAKIHDTLVDTIGNLTITAYNPELSNLPFEEKKKIYAASHYSLNGYFSQCPSWGSKQIEDRANELWERAKELWSAPRRPGQLKDRDEVEGDPELSDESTESTDSKLIEAKRELIVSALSQREGVDLRRKGGITLYSSADGEFRAVCIVSKRYPRTYLYWYGYSTAARRFLLDGQRSFLVLGCLDLETAYAIPSSSIEQILGQLWRTPEIKWHINLAENGQGRLELPIPNNAPMQLGDFELKLTP
jgi:uncharacterized protein with ParB-like and HNH nuclease domain